MRKQWRKIARLAAMAGLCWLGARGAAQAQVEPWKSDINEDIPYVGRGAGQVEAPQYPQYVQYPQGAPPVMPGVPEAAVMLTAGQLDQLLGPIALYPDPLLSLIFPAATYPQDVVAAEQWLQATPNPTEADIAAQSWDASIKGLVHYPSVLADDERADQLDPGPGRGILEPAAGRAGFHPAAARPGAGRAESPNHPAGAGGHRRRLPSASSRWIPSVIYVPQYDPNAVYAGACPITFGVGFPIGLWCDNDFDWHRHYIVTGGGWYQRMASPGGMGPASAGMEPPPGRMGCRAQTLGARAAEARAAAHACGRRQSRPRSSARGAAAKPAAARVRTPPASHQIGKQPAPAASKNVFAATQSRSSGPKCRAARRPRPSRPRQRPRLVAGAGSEPAARAPAPRASACAAPLRRPHERRRPHARAPARPAPQPARSSAFSGGSARRDPRPERPRQCVGLAPMKTAQGY